MNRFLRASLVPVSLLLGAGLVIPGAAPPANAAEKPVTPEKNPPGDIPDSQVFIDFQSSLGFTLKVPEGWSRTDLPSGAVFADKYNTITIRVAPADHPPAANASDPQVVDLVSAGRAAKVTGVKKANLAGGAAIQIVYSANSEANAVTNKQIRLEGNRYLFFKNGELATLDLTAPLGADNVDQWQLMANSFRWR